MRLSVLAMAGISLALGGCIAEDDPETVVNEQGETVTDPTVALNGFWDGVLNEGATSEANMRVLIYNGNLYAVDENSGYYGTTVLDDSDQMAVMALTSYALSAASDTDAEQYIANGSEHEVDFDVQLASISSSNDSLFGGFSIDGTASGNVELTRDGTWRNNAPLSKLTLTGKWTATGYEMVMSSSAAGVSFTGVTTDDSGCQFTGSISTLDTDYNLYRVSMTERSSCPDFNENSASGYAGFNTDGELEFYLRKDPDLLFMTFAPPADSTDTTDTTTDTTDTTDTTTE